MDRCLQQLYRAIVEPLADVLPKGGDLVIVPHGPLHGIPFHSLHDGAQYLAERYTITYAPSAGVFAACRRKARPLGRRLLVVGIDDPGLPYVAHEIESVAETWGNATALSGRRATSRALWRQAGSFDVLHLATHGVFRADNPAFSSVKLADAWLTVADLAEVARGAQLVTLSACETGVSGLSAGDEVVGLTRGLLAAGCTAVIASLWTVSDQSTAYLMEHLYRGLRSGMNAAAALGAAMNDVRAEYDHPYFWAPFVVSGSGLGVADASAGSPTAAAASRG
jgi:CHAT domain-containing protein